MFIKPSEIRYCQGSICNVFDNSIPISKTAEQIISGEISVYDIPKIKVFSKAGLWFTRNNRRLWVFKRAEQCGAVVQIEVQVCIRYDESKFTTTNEGTSVDICDSPTID